VNRAEPKATKTWPQSRLAALLAKLERHYGVPEIPRFAGPFEMIIWEIVAYLADDSRRELAFRALHDQVGLTPLEILAAPAKVLAEITRMGGSIAAEDRAARLRTAARIVMEDFDGDLSAVLTLPTQKAKKFLMRFPMIGEPGAEKILMLSGVLGVLALESNGVRVLTRLGIGEDRKSYAATYKSIREVTVEQLPADSALLTKAHLLLRHHGQTLCLRNGPACRACPVSSDCPAAQASA
jgi:endonuclease III